MAGYLSFETFELSRHIGARGGSQLLRQETNISRSDGRMIAELMLTQFFHEGVRFHGSPDVADANGIWFRVEGKVTTVLGDLEGCVKHLL